MLFRSSLAEYIPEQIRRVLEILIDRGFIMANGGLYEFNAKGHFASHIAEIHPLAFTDFVFHTNFLKDWNTQEIVLLLSCFADLRVPEDLVVYDPSNTGMDNRRVLSALMFLKNQYHEYEKEETEGVPRICTGISYKRAMQYDLLDPMMEWKIGRAHV